MLLTIFVLIIIGSVMVTMLHKISMLDFTQANFLLLSELSICYYGNKLNKPIFMKNFQSHKTNWFS